MTFNPKVSRTSMDKVMVTCQDTDELYVGLFMRDLTADGEHVTVASATGRILFMALSHQEYINHTNEVNRLKNDLAEANRRHVASAAHVPSRLATGEADGR